MTFEMARAVAEAVLYEGYLLYPYRASAQKNQIRWQWGVLAPPGLVAEDTGERDRSHAELILEPKRGTTFHIAVRFLQLQSRGIEAPTADGEYTPVTMLDLGDERHLTWDEAVDREMRWHVTIDDLRAGTCVKRIDVPGTKQVESLTDGSGAVRGRIVRRCWPIAGEIAVALHDLPGPYGAARLAVTVGNTSDWNRTTPDLLIDPAKAGQVPLRDRALRRGLLSAHVMLHVSNGRFVSLSDPPEWAATYTQECRSDGLWPVLIGDPAACDTVLASPIILADFPVVAPESPGNYFDATEIDELLTLRTMTLTDTEKAEARSTDPRVREIIDRADDLPPEILDRLHGAIRYVDGAPPAARQDPPVFQTPTESDAASEQPPWWDPGADTSVDPETDTYPIDGVAVGRGTIVRLRPGIRRADAQDMFLHDREARVEAVLFDLDGQAALAVTLLDDPAAELNASTGRFLYFSPDEVVPSGQEAAS